MEIKFHYQDTNGQKALLERITSLTKKHHEVVVVCLGTDRSSGDSMGPLVGTFLKEEYPQAKIYGTLAEPVHAVNLSETLKKIENYHPNAYVIAVDASLGRSENVDNIILSEEPLKPGTAVNKNLPEVGHVTIKGVVNVGGFMSQVVLQSTRFYTTYNLARVIAGTLAQALIAHKNFSYIYKVKEA